MKTNHLLSQAHTVHHSSFLQFPHGTYHYFLFLIDFVTKNLLINISKESLQLNKPSYKRSMDVYAVLALFSEILSIFLNDYDRPSMYVICMQVSERVNNFTVQNLNLG